MLGISACLAGIACRYDGNHHEIAELKAYVENGSAQLLCPETLGGLPTPREPAEIQGGDGFDVWRGTAKVVAKNGEDVTEQFKAGAKKAYQELKNQQITRLILKANSPSCGSQQIYDGSFSGVKKSGVGVATAYFIQQGLAVFSEETWQKDEETNGN